MLKKLLAVIALLIVCMAVFVATRPATFQVERSITMAAPAGVVFAEINDFHQWSAWSPWEQLDPGMKRTFEGSDAGVGATYSWTGNDKVGEGRMRITESHPNESVGIQLDFIKPFASTNQFTFTLSPDGSSTRVTWHMLGNNNFMSKAMSVMASMDKMIGPDFERGLGQLKRVSEAAAASPGAAATPATDKPASPAGQ